MAKQLLRVNINRESSYDLEGSWEYHFMGDKFCIFWLNSKLENEGFEIKQTSDYGHYVRIVLGFPILGKLVAVHCIYPFTEIMA